MELKLCKTAYPIILVHGAGFRDLRIPVYWGRIPRVLKEHGADVFFGEQDSWGSVETNAHALCERIDAVLAKTGAKKVNLIAHSKGGVEARMAASSLGYGAKIFRRSVCGQQLDPAGRRQKTGLPARVRGIRRRAYGAVQCAEPGR